jgi:hypothetical protein
MGHVREPERDDWWKSWLVRTTRPVAEQRHRAVRVLTAASASSPTAADFVVQTLTGVADAAGVPITVADTVPVSSGDSRGLVPFYLVVGLVLAATWRRPRWPSSWARCRATSTGRPCGSARSRSSRCSPASPARWSPG